MPITRCSARQHDDTRFRTPFGQRSARHALAWMTGLVTLLVLWMSAATALARELPPPRSLAIDPADMVSVELATVGVDQASGTPVALLREPVSGAIVPILIGVNEARAILMALEGVDVPRPMTHDLLFDVTQAAGLRLERLMVDALRNNTYFGMLDFRDAENADAPPLLVDTRPSDGLALAVRARAGILVAPAILQQPDRDIEGLPGQQGVVSALDITVVAVTDTLRQALALPDDDGVLVSAARGRAEASGIGAGSMILSVNGHPVDSPMAYLQRVSETPPDQLVELRVWQAGEAKTIRLPTDVPEPGADEQPRIAL